MATKREIDLFIEWIDYEKDADEQATRNGRIAAIIDSLSGAQKLTIYNQLKTRKLNALNRIKQILQNRLVSVQAEIDDLNS